MTQAASAAPQLDGTEAEPPVLAERYAVLILVPAGGLCSSEPKHDSNAEALRRTCNMQPAAARLLGRSRWPLRVCVANLAVSIRQHDSQTANTVTESRTF